MAAFVFVKLTFFTTVLAFVSSTATSPAEHASPDQTPQQSPTLKILKLQRSSVMLPKSAERAGKRKNFYAAKLSVGKPAQEFHVSFDLGGGTMVLRSNTCTDPACLGRHRYDKWASETAEDIQADGRLVQPNVPKTLISRRDRGTLGLESIDLGSGKVVGNFVRDEVCVSGEGDVEEDGKPRCFPLAMLVANSMSDLPFITEPYDGTVGLGLQGMSVNAGFNFLAAFKQGYASMLPSNSFGLHIGTDEDGGEITLGGYDTKRLTHPLKWTNVAAAEEGRWQVDITAIRVGNATIEACREHVCRAALDYSSSLLAVPPRLAGNMEAALAGLATPQGFGDGCQHVSLPDVTLELAGDVTIALPAEDYVDDLGSKTASIGKPLCEPRLVQHHADETIGEVFIIGEATLRRYYTFFDADSLKVGFSPAAAAGLKGAETSPALPGAEEESGKKWKSKTLGEGSVYSIFLVQVKLKRSRTLASVSL